MKKSQLILALTSLAALSFCGAASAQTAGSITGSIGITAIAPDVSSGDLSAPSLLNTKADVNRNTQITGALNYAVTDNIVVNVPLGLGFKHKVTGAGAIAGVGVIATTKALPITALGQYRFLEPKAQFRPYVGAGLSYVNFYKETGTSILTALTNPGGPATTVKFKDRIAPAIQLGIVYNVNDKWYIDAAYMKSFFSTTGTLSTGQTLKMQLNPDALTFQVGYKF